MSERYRGHEHQAPAVGGDFGEPRQSLRGVAPKEGDGPTRQTPPKDAAHDGDQQRLGDQGPDQPRPARAQRRAKGDLGLPLPRTGQGQTRRVYASDHQEKHHAGQRESQTAGDSTNDMLPVGSHHGAHQKLVNPGEALGGIVTECHTGIGIGKPGECGDGERIRIPSSGHELPRNPDRPVTRHVLRRHEVGGQDTDDPVTHTCYVELAPDRIRIASEALEPESVVQDGDRLGVQPLVLLVQQPAWVGRRPQKLEEARAHPVHDQSFGVAQACDRGWTGGDADHHFGGPGIENQVAQLSRRQRAKTAPVVRELGAYHEQPVRIRVGQRPQHHPVEDGEDRSGSTDSEAHRPDGEQGEHRGAHQPPEDHSRLVQNGPHPLHTPHLPGSGPSTGPSSLAIAPPDGGGRPPMVPQLAQPEGSHARPLAPFPRQEPLQLAPVPLQIGRRVHPQ